MTHDDDLDTIRTLLRAARTATVTTRTASGALHSRPLALLEGDFDGTLWFFTADPSPKTEDLRVHPEVNVAVGSDKGYLSLSGTGRVDRDPARIDELWNPWAEAYFENGRQDPAVALLRVDVETAELWDTEKPLIVKAFEIGRAIMTKTPPDVGDSTTLRI